MAGIGFELRKVINKGGLGSFVQIAVSGAMIVAGPWLLTIITITAIQTFIPYSTTGSLELFMGIVIYCYAFSLFLFGGFHYLFTRRMSDLLYKKKESQAFGYVLQLCIPVTIVSIIIALPAVLSMSPNVEHLKLLKAASVTIFAVVNCLWVVMLFVSVLKWYIKILIIYASGLLSSLLLIYLLSIKLGPAGGVLGFAAGHLIILLLLIVLCRIAWKPERPEPPEEINYRPGFHPVRTFAAYLVRHKYLFGSGLFYYFGIWIDKMIFWLFYGETTEGTFIRLFQPYDIPVYLSNLTMIPGLVFFVVFSETEFYTALKRFLFRLARGRYTEIVDAKNSLHRITASSIREQCILQAVITLIIIMLTKNTIFRTTLAAVYFHLLLLTLLNYLFYLEKYKSAFISSLVFFSVNIALAMVTVVLNGPLPPGASYLLSAAAAAITAAGLLKKGISTLERHILTKR